MDQHETVSQGQISDPFLCRKKAAAYLGVAPKTLANWISARRYNLPFVKVGARVLYRKSDLEKFIAENRVDPAEKRRKIEESYNCVPQSSIKGKTIKKN